KIEKLKNLYLSANQLRFWEITFKNYNIKDDKEFILKFEQLPITNNKVINKNFENMYHKNKYKSSIQSSGSTGNPTKIYRNKNFEPIQWAFWWRYRNNLGIKKNEWSAVFSSKMISTSTDDLFRINYVTRQIYFNSYLLNNKSS